MPPGKCRPWLESPGPARRPRSCLSRLPLTLSNANDEAVHILRFSLLLSRAHHMRSTPQCMRPLTGQPQNGRCTVKNHHKTKQLRRVNYTWHSLAGAFFKTRLRDLAWRILRILLPTAFSDQDPGGAPDASIVRSSPATVKGAHPQPGACMGARLANLSCVHKSGNG